MEPGEHFVRMQHRCSGSGWLNGAGLSGYWVRHRD
jgi:hypothetical protein